MIGQSTGSEIGLLGPLLDDLLVILWGDSQAWKLVDLEEQF